VLDLRRVLACAATALVASGCSSDSTAPEPPPAYTIEALTLTPEDESSPSLSPDGARVAFVRGGAIVVRDVTSGTETTAVAHGDSPLWDDAASIYYVRRDTGPLIHRLVHRALSSGAETVVTPDSIDAYDPAISPDRARIVYRALSRTTLRQNLRVLVLAQEREFDLTAPAAWTDGAPSWSRDERIAFVRLFEDGSSQIWTVAAQAEATPSAIVTARQNAADPAWSMRSGGRLAFSRGGEIVSLPASGGSPAALVRAPGFAMAPEFGQDGKSLVYVSNRFGNFDVFLLRAQEDLGAGPYVP
jgi:Tol biopolymer transport system component